jgi:hypothetical protein
MQRDVSFYGPGYAFHGGEDDCLQGPSSSTCMPNLVFNRYQQQNTLKIGAVTIMLTRVGSLIHWVGSKLPTLSAAAFASFHVYQPICRI